MALEPVTTWSKGEQCKEYGELTWINQVTDYFSFESQNLMTASASRLNEH